MTAFLAPLPADRRGAERPLAPAGAPLAAPLLVMHRRVRAAGVAAVSALLAASLLAPDAVGRAALPLAVVGILLGIPHGAVDHVVPGWLARRRLGPGALAALLGGYVGVAAVGTLALRWAPTPTMITFLAVSAWHFGRAETVTAAETAGRAVPPAGSDLPLTLAHGLVTAVLPLAAWPAVALPVIGTLAPGWASASRGALQALAAGIVLGALTVAAHLARRGRWADAGQLGLLTATFALVHPFAAFGVYFGAWHAARHGARLVETAAGPGPLRRGLQRYLTQAAAPTVAALGFLLAIRATARDGASPLLAAELATLLALTFPHAAVVALMDGALRRTGGR